MSAILKTSDSTLKLPALTSDVEQGKRDMDEYGLCVHRDFITPEQVKRLKDRLVEQAEQECEYGVALLSGSSRSGKHLVRPPRARARAGLAGHSGALQQGPRVHRAAVESAVTPTYAKQCFAATRSTCRR